VELKAARLHVTRLKNGEVSTHTLKADGAAETRYIAGLRR